MKHKYYDLIMPIGQGCAASYILSNLNMRSFSLPLDWTFMDNYSDGINVLKKRFENYFDKNDLEFEYYDPKTLTDIYSNKSNHIRHVHYFPSQKAEPFEGAYQKIREMYERRIKRFFDIVNNQKPVRILLLYIERAFDEEYTENERAKSIKVTNGILENDISELNEIYGKKCFDILYIKHDKVLQKDEFFFDGRILHINNLPTGDYKLCKGNHKLIEKILQNNVRINGFDYINNLCKKFKNNVRKLYIIIR